MIIESFNHKAMDRSGLQPRLAGGPSGLAFPTAAGPGSDRIVEYRSWPYIGRPWTSSRGAPLASPAQRLLDRGRDEDALHGGLLRRGAGSR